MSQNPNVYITPNENDVNINIEVTGPGKDGVGISSITTRPYKEIVVDEPDESKWPEVGVEVLVSLTSGIVESFIIWHPEFYLDKDGNLCYKYVNY